MLYGHLEKEYAEDNDLSLSKAYGELHCQDEEPIAEMNEQGELEFESITQYVEWYKYQRRRQNAKTKN